MLTQKQGLAHRREVIAEESPYHDAPSARQIQHDVSAVTVVQEIL